MTARAEIDPSYDPAALLNSRYGEEDRITIISPALRRLLDACCTLLVPGWKYHDGFRNQLSFPYVSDELSLVYVNPSSGGIRDRHAFTEVIAYLKPELRTFRAADENPGPGWVLPDSITHPLADALQPTHYRMEQAELGFNPVRYGKELFFQTGVLVFDLYLSDSRTQLYAAEAESRAAVARLESLRQAAANIIELF